MDLFAQMTLTRGPAWRNRFMLAPLTNLQSHPDGTPVRRRVQLADLSRQGRVRPGHDLRRARAAHRPGLSRPARHLLATTTCRGSRGWPRAIKAAAPSPRRNCTTPACARLSALIGERAGRAVARTPRPEHARALDRRGRAADRGLHRRRRARREGRLRRGRAARRARLHPVRLPQPRDQPARGPLRRLAGEPRAHRVRHHQGRARAHSGRLPARGAHLARAVRPHLRRAARARRAPARLGRPRLSSTCRFGIASSRRSRRSSPIAR